MNMVAEMLLREPAPMAIWAALMLLTLPAVLVLASPQGVRHPWQALLETVGFLRERDERRRQDRAEAVQAVRYAEEVGVAAERARDAADRWQHCWELAEERRAAAWQAWVEADDRLLRTRAAAAFGTPRTPQDPSEYAARERFLHQAVRNAAQRGDLPAAAVADALAGRCGWDARLHPVEQELAVRRGAAAHLLAEYERAARTEQVAWHDAQLAVQARESLRREAGAAAARAAAVRHLVPAGRPIDATGRGLAGDFRYQAAG